MSKAIRGSISLVLLFGCCFLAALIALISHSITQEYEKQLQQLQFLQLRTLAESTIAGLAQLSTQEEGTHQLQAVTLYPGKHCASLSYSYFTSTDSCFSVLTAQAETKNAQANFQQLKFIPSDTIQSLANSYGVIASYGITNSKYLPEGTLYTSNGNFTVPELSFLAAYGRTALDLEELHSNGGNGSFIYIENSTAQTRLTYNASLPVTKGTLLIASHGNILVEKNFQAPNRLILLTDQGTITLEDNVSLQSALIISKGRLTIGKSCKLRGIFMAQDRIVLQGSCTITQDTDVVAPFVSPIHSFAE